MTKRVAILVASLIESEPKDEKGWELVEAAYREVKKSGEIVVDQSS